MTTITLASPLSNFSFCYLDYILLLKDTICLTQRKSMGVSGIFIHLIVIFFCDFLEGSSIVGKLKVINVK